MDMNDILARLKNGETADDIAKSLTEMLNTANKQYNEEKAKEEAEAKAKADLEAKKAKLEKQKMESFCLLFEDFKVFLHEYYGYEYADLDKIAAKDILAVIDAYRRKLKLIKEIDNGKLQERIYSVPARCGRSEIR